MMSHFPNPNLDPHAEAIDGAPVDPWPVDNRVKVARHATWLVGDDPAPEYSACADSLRTPGPVIQEPPHSMFGVLRRLYWVLAVTPVVGVLVVVFLLGRWTA